MVLPRSVNSRLYVHDLGSLLTVRRLYDPDYALAQDPEFYEKMRKYPPIDGAIDMRKRMVAGSDWFLEPSSSAVGDRVAIPLFEALLKELRGFAMARYHLAESLIKGSSWAEIVGEWRVLDIPPFPRMRWWVITGLRDIDKRRFSLIRDDDLEPGEYRWHIESPFPPYDTRPIEREHYVRVAYGTDEASLGYGRGLAESLVYPFWYASGLDEHSAQFGERWAQGFRVWKLGTQAQTASPSTTDKRAAYLDIVDTFVSRYAAVVDAEDEFQLHDAPAQGFEYITKRQDYYNAICRVRILGSAMMTDPHSDGGSYALGDAQFENTTQLMVFHDRGVFDESFTHDAMGLLWRANYQNFLSLGIRTSGPPKFHTRDLQQHSPEKRAPVIKTAIEIGLPVSAAEAYRQLELTPPEEGEATIGGAPAAPAGAPGAAPGAPAPPGPGRPNEGADNVQYPSTQDQAREGALASKVQPVKTPTAGVAGQERI